MSWLAGLPRPLREEAPRLLGAHHLWLYLPAVALSFVRQRALQLLLYLALVALTAWAWLTQEAQPQARLAGLAEALALPALLTAVAWLGLAAVRRAPARGRAIANATVLALLALWAVFKFAAPRGLLLGAGQRLGLALPDLAVLGASYVVLKLAHVVLDAGAAPTLAVRGSTLLALVYFPPTFASGPMHRYEELAPAFEALPGLRARQWRVALRRLAWGAAKAAVAGPYLARWCLPILAAPGAHGAGELWLAMYAYAALIYLDFSGVSDLAVGLGAALGVPVPENFNAPYLKLDLQTFWRSWHITLTRALQAYVYMPVSKRLMKAGLRKRPRLIVLAANVVTFGLCGLWHGATGNYLVWGLYHGLGIFLYTGLPVSLRAPTGEAAQRLSAKGLLWWLLTLQFVCFGWVLFACSLPDAGAAFARMFFLGR